MREPGAATHSRWSAAVAACCLTLAPLATSAQTANGEPPASALHAANPLPSSRLTVRVGNTWREWWRSDAPFPALSANDEAVLARVVGWHVTSPGVEWGELALGGTGEGWRTRLVVVRLDPALVRLALDTAFTERGGAAWRLDRAPHDAVFAVNAGQFLLSLPWGLVVLDGRQYLAPGHGPLVTTVAVDSSGAVSWVHGGAAPATRAAVRWAFQSYPTLVAAGRVPAALRADAGLLDVRHRDARAAIGALQDGRLLVTLTRFDAFGGALDFVPLGLTVPEMAAVMGALGARDAVLLDGGISAQMLVRDQQGSARRWPGLRAVPLALVAYPRH